jgi:hypothetical protein
MASQNKSKSPLQKLLERLRQWLRRKPEPEDPYAYRMAPLRRPPGKGGAAAIAELDED